MSETRHDSDPTVPIPATEMRRILAEEGYEPLPDDETPTSPDVLASAERAAKAAEAAAVVCPVCSGTKKTIQETATGYHGPVPCPACAPPPSSGSGS